MARIVLAMSGGVDSSVAAHLLRDEGHEVVGLFMRHGPAALAECASDSAAESPLPIVPLAHKQGCCTAADAADARRVADRLGIAFYALDFEQEFGRIIDYFVDEYVQGRTPNPCVMCNNWLKFGRLVEFADSVGAELLATGHYAQLRPGSRPGDPPALVRGADAGKDQSYVLFGIDRDVLPRLRFPVGGYRKPEIRARAEALGLRVADKPDSQEICFVGEGDYADFVRERAPLDDRGGEIVTTQGAIVGAHEGVEGFTVGQRRGLGVALGERRYVVRIEPETHRVVIGRRQELARTEISARASNWLVDPPDEEFGCQVQIRYQAHPARARVRVLSGERFVATLDEPQFGVAPGQALVCYAQDRVLGGGWIE